MLCRHVAAHSLDNEGLGLLFECRRADGQPLRGCARDAAPTLEQEKMFHGAERNLSALVLLDTDESALDRLFVREVRKFRVRLADDVGEGEVEEIWPIGGRIDKHCSTERLVASLISDRCAEPLEHRLAGVNPDGLVALLGAHDGEPSLAL
ncbi:MAG: hypothetical protein KJZ68_08160, partial [Phycisphaerales bacterium]|nr:hypothetical protein [Phycisphaerales bacterium]